MSNKLLLIINPNSGKGNIKNSILKIIDTFVKDEWTVSVHTTQRANDAYEYVRDNGINFDRIVACGGDGTINEVICGIMEIDKELRPEIGYIPAGTVNDFASNMKISTDPQKAAKNIVNGKKFLCDIGDFNKKSFIYVAAFGAFTNVSYETSQQSKNMLGQLAYFLEGIKQLHALPSYKLKIETETETICDEFILGMVSNSNRIAGIKRKKTFKAQLNDGLFEVFLVKTPKTLIELRDLGRNLLTQRLDTDAIKIFRTNKIRFTSDENIQWTLDGEFGGSVSESTIEVQKEAVAFII